MGLYRNLRELSMCRLYWARGCPKSFPHTELAYDRDQCDQMLKSKVAK